MEGSLQLPQEELYCCLMEGSLPREECLMMEGSLPKEELYCCLMEGSLPHEECLMMEGRGLSFHTGFLWRSLTLPAPKATGVESLSTSSS